jgi:transposase-like protein
LEGALGLMLVGAGVVDQRYHAVMEVLAAGVPVVEVAERYGVSRETVHAWLNRYRDGGLAGLADRSHRARGRVRGWCPPSAMSSAIAFAFP